MRIARAADERRETADAVLEQLRSAVAVRQTLHRARILCSRKFIR